MKKAIIFFIVINFILSVKAQSPTFEWAKVVGSSCLSLSVNNGKTLAIDTLGNTYSVGSFAGTVDFDPGSGIFNLTSATTNFDTFILKLDSVGNFVWAKNIGGAVSSDRVIGYSIALSKTGNLYVTGLFSGAIDFDPSSSGVTILSTAPTGQDIFVFKLDSLGDFVWAESMVGAGGASGYSIAIDSLENIYTTGYFSGTVDFDPGPGVTIYSSPIGTSKDMFILKLDSNGNFIWAKHIGSVGTSNCIACSIAIDKACNVYITGFFQWTVDFNPGIGVFYLTAGAYNMFVVKFDSFGNFLWADNIGDTGNIGGNSIIIDGLGNIYTTGCFVGGIDFDPGVGTFYMTSPVSQAAFISKLDSTGNFIWAKSLAGNLSTDNITGFSIIVDNNNNVYSTGEFNGKIDFDPGIGLFDLTASGSTDMFISKLNTSGDFVWALDIGGWVAISSYARGSSIKIDKTNNLYTLGYFYGTV
ncbi:MAG: hypothetical protein NTX97_15010, partial [Bacteroidetes bacterium]|nr:hypothetical protein [Bacteroidota bacterium]